MSTSGATGFPMFAGKVDRKHVDSRPRSDDSVPPEPDDETLMQRMQESDMAALGLLFHRYSKLTLGIARRVLRDNDEADDLVQDIFLFLYFKSKLFDPSKGSARSWVIQVTYHRAYDRRRYLSVRSFYDRTQGDEGRKVLLSAINPGGENPEEFLAWQSILRPAFEELSEDQRNTIVLHFYEGYTLREISKKLGRSFGNVQHDYYRGMDRLRKYVFDKSRE
jgi:RNA polymerase sigma-70 factor (ECF subfamily)